LGGEREQRLHVVILGGDRTVPSVARLWTLLPAGR
jgi:hypothetical protein